MTRSALGEDVERIGLRLALPLLRDADHAVERDALPETVFDGGLQRVHPAHTEADDVHGVAAGPLCGGEDIADLVLVLERFRLLHALVESPLVTAGEELG